MGQTVQQRSRLLRVAVGVVLLLAALAAAGLVFEWINVTRGMPIHRVTRFILLGVTNLIFTACLAAIAGLYLWVRMAQSLPDLMGWHVQRPESEFRAVNAEDGYTLDDYREQEDRVFGELNSYIAQSWSAQSAGAIVLFSPMIGINPLARVTRLYHTVGLVSRNEKSRWSSIYAEIDPFKYNSWPMNGNVQAWNLTKVVEQQLAALEQSGRMHELPPVLAMQSVVDSTVVVPKLITVLFDRLTSESSELFLFDVNRMDSLSNLLNLSFERTILPSLERTDRPFKLTVMGNAQPNSRQLSLKVRDNGRWTEQPVNMFWPQGFVSLSHLAIPFPPNDPVYGHSSYAVGLSLGSLSMRAEPNALMIPTSLFARCRYNPFYVFMEDRVVNWLSQTLACSGPSHH